MDNCEKFLNVESAAAFLGIKKSYCYKLIHEHRLPFYKPLNGKILFDRDELDNFVRSTRHATGLELDEKANAILNGSEK